MAEGGENIGLDDMIPADEEEVETSFIEGDDNPLEEADPFLSERSRPGDRLIGARRELTKDKVDSFIKKHGITDEGAKTDLYLNTSIRANELYYKKLRLTYGKGKYYYADSTLKRQSGGSAFVRDILNAPAETVAAPTEEEPDWVAQTLRGEDRFNKILEREIPLEDVTPREIGLLRDEYSLIRGNRDYSDRAKNIDEIIDDWNDVNPDYRVKEAGLTLANMSKAELNRERDNILFAGPDEEPAELSPELRTELAKIEEKIDFWEDYENKIRESLAPTRSLRDIIHDKDLSLRAKSGEIFERRGITIGAILLALGLSISTIALAVSRTVGGGAGAGTGAGDGKDSGAISPYSKAKEIVKQFGNWLKTLAAKSAAAIPGLIGSVVSFILKSAGTVVGFIAEELWIFVTAMTFYLINRLTT